MDATDFVAMAEHIEYMSKTHNPAMAIEMVARVAKDLATEINTGKASRKDITWGDNELVLYSIMHHAVKK